MPVTLPWAAACHSDGRAGTTAAAAGLGGHLGDSRGARGSARTRARSAPRPDRGASSGEAEHITELGDRTNEALVAEGVEQVRDGARWVLERGGLLEEHVRDRTRSEVEEIEDEVVRMLGLDAVRLERAGREVAEIGGHDRLRGGADRGGEDMAIVGVGKVEPVDERFVPRRPSSRARP